MKQLTDVLHTFTWAVFIIAALMLVAFVLWIVRFTDRRFARFDYEAVPILSDGEKEFYRALVKAVGQDHLVFAKVRLLDLINVKSGSNRTNAAFWEAFNRIAKRHVDFVIVNSVALNVVCVVELDDKSHAKPGQDKKDKFLNDVLNACGYAVHRVKAASRYNWSDLQVDIRLAWQNRPIKKNA